MLRRNIGVRMLYALHEAAYYGTTPWRIAAQGARAFWNSPINPAAGTEFARTASASADLFVNLTRRYAKPDWMIDQIEVNGHPVRVRPTTVWESPWCKLVQFDRDMADMRRAGHRELDPA